MGMNSEHNEFVIRPTRMAKSKRWINSSGSDVECSHCGNKGHF